jgi:hypothetical protein
MTGYVEKNRRIGRQDVILDNGIEIIEAVASFHEMAWQFVRLHQYNVCVYEIQNQLPPSVPHQGDEASASALSSRALLSIAQLMPRQ